MPSGKTRAQLEQQIAELEKRLAESEACLDLFGIEAPAGLGIFDRECRYVRLNRTLASFANLSPAEHLGKKPSEILPPPLATHIENYVREILATGEPQLNQPFTCAIPAGSEPPRHWLASRFPLRTAGGEIFGVGVVVVEKTDLQQLRHSLSQRESLHQALLESIPARIFMKDCAGTYLYCNEIFAADVGLAPAEIIGKDDLDLFRPEMAERYRQADLEVIASGQTREFEYQFEKYGTTYYIHVRKTPFRDEAGNIHGILGVFQDLTEKRQAERQLLIADHALAGTLAGVAIANPAGELTYANPAFLKMWGFADHEIPGRPAAEFWTNPSAARRVLKELRNTGQWQGEMTACRKDGTTFPTLLAANIVNDETGQPLGLIASVIDITARKRAERERLNSEEQLRQIVDNIDEAVWIMDTTEERLLFISPAYEKIWGRPRQELFRNPEAWLESVHPDDRERLIAVIHNRGREKKQSFRLILPDGTIKQVFSRTFPVLNQSGRVYREVGIIQDVSEIKAAEGKILAFSRQLNNAIEEERLSIARDLHDEFGQALIRLRQWQNTLGEALPVARKELVDVDGFNAIVNQLGDIIRDTTHRLRPDILDNLGLAAAIAWEVREFGKRFKTVKADFQTTGQARPLASEHALVLYRVLQEALTNIARHARAKQVTVRLIFSFPTTILNVEDDGVGFIPDDSAGFGLRGISERMATIGGQARISSQPGHGTSIRVEVSDGQIVPANGDGEAPANPAPQQAA